MNIIKLAGVEFYPDEIEKHFANGKQYIIKANSVYQVFYSVAQKSYYTHKIYTKPAGGVPLMNPRRYWITTGENVNDLLMFKLVNA